MTQEIRTNFDDDNDGAIDRTAFDPDGDGIADRIDHYTSDDDGARRVIRRDFDLDDDGTINRTAHLNAEGRWERVDLDTDDDGNIDRSETYTFAADGARSLTRTDFDVDDDGTTDRSETYTYNSNGTLIRTGFDDDNDGTIDRTAFDPDGDGTADRIDHYTSDDDGARRVIRRDFDLDDDGTINRTAHLNAEGRWERVDLDTDDDGNIDRSDRYTFAADGARSLTRTDFDTDGDGTADRSETYTYNSDGTLIRTAFDDDADGAIDRTAFDPDSDGTADRIDHYTSDDDGARRVIRRDFDLDDDGTINRTAHLNAEGRWERVDLDTDDDGNIDRSDHYTFAADGARSLTRTDFDTDGDGTADRSETYTYNSDGTLIRTGFDDDNDGAIDRTAIDPDGDGTADRIDHYTSDDDGARRVIRRDFDLDDDGTINRTAHLNAEGRWERVDLDTDDDGNIDRSDHYTFAADGARSLTRTAFDVDDDGTTDRSETYTYNSDGTLIRTGFDDDNDGAIDRTAIDPDGDGTADRIDHYTSDDDGARRVIRRDFDLDDDGTINRTAHLNAEGRWERVDLDTDDDGNIDRSETYTFAADGARSLTRTDFDVDDDGTTDRSETYTYNSNGTLIRTGFDDDNDGTIDRTAFDPDGDGTADRIDHYTSDDDGARRVIRRDFDLDDDGTINRTAHLNAEGRWERVDLDTDDDGNIDRSDRYTFAADGARSLTRTAFDVDDDGTTDRSETYTYNSPGTLIRTGFDDDNDGAIDRTAIDPDGDGTADRIDHYTSDDDGARRVIRRDFDLDDDGTINRTAHLNAEGRWERVDLDTDDDGNIDRSDHYTFAADGARSLTRTETYTYNSDGALIRTNFDDDADGNIDRAALDTDGDGTADRSETYFYTNSRRTRTEFDDDADGNIDRVSVTENQIAAYEAAAADAEGDPLSYSLSGTDAALFTIDANTGAVSFRAAPDFEAPGDDDGDNVYDIIVTASDGANSTEQPVAITVTNDNDNPPAFTSPATVRVAENQVAAYEADAADAEGDPLSYSLSGTDAALFTIDANTGAVSFRAAPDFEAPGDDDGDNVYDIIVTASDDTNSTEQPVAITVTNENDNAPAFTSPATVRVAENQVAAYEAAATDADGDPLSYSLSGTDAALFTIDANTGAVSFRAAPDFEAPGDDDGDNVYDIIVTASDDTNSTEQPVAITVTNENDNVPAFTSPATARVAENQVAAYEAAAADADGGPLSYSLSGTDAALFTIDANTGAVSFRAAPDFEAPGDADGDNVYDIIVTASDDTNSTNQNVAITVTNENDNVPAFTSPATARVAENQVAAYEAAAADADGGPLSYSLSGTDAALFTIDANTGAVSFRAAPDFEAPGDDDGDNVYDIIVTASDDTNSTEQPVAITVTNENDNVPAFTSPATVRVAENQVAAYEAAAADADGGPLSYSLSGTDAGLFTIDANTGVVSFRAAPDFEAPGDADGDNVYDIIVTASDGANSTNQNVAITVTNENDNAPAFTSPATVRVAENQVAAYEAAAADADGGPLSYSLSGTDAALFMIDADTGAVSFRAAPDFEAPGDDDGDNVYDIIVTASDDTNSTEQPVAITVTNENDNVPAFTSPATARVAENQVAAYEAAAADADGDPLSYSLSGTDAALFTIDADTGVVSFRAAPDFEAPGDADGDNVYDIIVTASDDTNSTEQPVAITVTNENDNAPAFTSPATVRVAENQVAAYEAAAADADGGPLSYSLSGTDAALFMIDADTGAVSFRAAPDFEAPGDADRDNVYDIIVTASDGANSTEQPVAITVTNDNDNPPAFTSPATVRVAENQVAAYEAAAADADGDPPRYSLSGTDAALFTIDANTGVVSFRAAPDFEAPGDADGDNVYDIIVTASDGANSTEQPVAITVTNENDNVPAFTSPATVRVAENQVAAYEAAAADADGDPPRYSLSGTDAALFTIDADTGAVSFRAAPDFEAPGDADGDNVYDIIVTASDDTNSTEQPVAITVTNDNDNAPAFTSPATVRVAENQVAAYEAAAADADGDPPRYSLSGTDAGLFTIDANTGVVSFRAAPDFEAPGDADRDNVYDIIVTASDGANSTEQPVAITVTNENDNVPAFTSLATVRVAENQVAAYEAAAADAEGGPLSYSLSGTDAALFTIDANTGAVSFRAAPDFEAPGDADRDNVYDIIVTASDGANSTEQPVAITVTNENDNVPAFTSPATVRVAENQVAAYEAAAADADGDPPRYSLSGTDAALFTIDANTGAVSFRAAPDFEAPGDDDGDNVYDIIVTASDDTNSTEQPVAITVTNENDNVPAFTSPATVRVAENQVAAYEAAAADADGGPLSYSLSGTDAALFTIDANTGAVSFRAAPDFEAPGDADGDNVYDIIVTASDDTNSTEQPVAITVTNENDNPPAFTSPATARVAENQVAAYEAAAADADGGPPRYSLSGTDAALFTIDANTGAVSFRAAPDFEAPGDAGGDNVYDIIVTASDGANSTEQPVAITVTNENDNIPAFTSPATVRVAENQVAAYEAAAADADGGPLSYSLSGTDAALFTIDANTGAVSFRAAPDFEAPGDAGGDNVYDIIVTASDGANSTEQPVAITVTNENDNPPAFTSPATIRVAENQVAAYEADAADAEGDPLSYSLSGTDAALFTIDANTGVVSFRAAPDFEAPGDADRDNVYDIIVTASDDTNSTEQPVAITVTNENDNPPAFTSPATARVAENQVAAYEAAAADADGGPLSYSLSGTDAALFMIDADTGAVSFRAAPDFEAPGDADRDNVYDIIVTASDDTNSTEQPVAITVTNENDNVPAFTSPATVRVAENQVAAYEAAAADADGDPLSYSLSGTDAALFTIDANTGAVSFRAAPDFEAPGDADRDNVYDIIVTASDGANSTEQPVAITVTNENDNAPAFTSPATVRVAENQVAAYEAAAADAEGDPLSYSLSGTDAALFTIDANTGAVSFRAAPDFEAPGDADRDNVYDIIVTASDDTNSTNQNVAITVTNENDNVPAFTSPATVRVAENQVAAYEAAAADADGGPLSYSLSGTDAALFTIDANTGAVSFRAAPDFEAPGDADRDNVYDIIVTASDGANSTEQPVAITVTNENDNAPAFTSPATVRVAENQVAAYEAAAADAEGDPLSYSLSGTDAALFTIDANTGAVSFRAAPDFEAPGDADGDNVYDIIVTASDDTNSTNQNVAITVTNENDNVPAFTSPATVRVAENQVAAYEAAAADADGDPLSYSLSGTDAALFTIDANTGAVSFRAAPDFEAPGDAGGDNVYDIIVTASDGANSTEQPVAITVTNENDNVPAFTSPATVRVAENQVAAYEAAATDADGDPLSYSLSGTDAALFTIDANTGAVSFRAAPDFEAPGDDDGDNVYDIIVTASDDTNSTNQNVAITVTNENDNVPAFTSPATVRVAENQVAAYEAAAADADGGPLSYSLSGTDAALFTIDANTGAVSFRAAPDFEAPGDDDGDNVYDIIVTASDGANSTEQPVAITVTNENDNVPAFTSPATVRVAENQVAAYAAAAADADGGPLSYGLSGTDAALFTIDANTGAVSFRAAPDFEAPGDADGDNVYDIIVTASDDTNSTEQPVTITVTNENEAPAFTSPATVRVAENQVAAYEADAADAEGDPLSYSLSGTDAALFTIRQYGRGQFQSGPRFRGAGR